MSIRISTPYLKMKVLFRLNAGSFGLGHLARNIGIYQSLKENNIESYFLIKSDDEDKITRFLRNEKIENDKFTFLPSNLTLADDAKYSIKFYKKGFSFLILDHYDHNIEYQQTLKTAGIKWAQFDYKVTDKIIADIIINANISSKKEDYLDIANSDAVLCVGYKYAIIRKSIIEQTATPQNNKILISMGGGPLSKDNRDLIIFLSKYDDFLFEIISNDTELYNLLQQKSNCTLYFNPSDVSEVYKHCEVAIVAGGVTTFELSYLNIPMFIVPFVDNQLQNAIAWDKNSFGRSYENTTDFIQEIEIKGLKYLIQNLKGIYSMKKISIDGLGVSRIIEEIIKLTE